MYKVYGARERQDGLYTLGYGNWQLIYGFYKENPDDETGWDWRINFDKEPSLQEVETIIKETINQETDQKILSGFIWRDMPIWLSTENQFNYKTAYDLAVQFGGANLPIKFKFGTDEDPIYFIFENMEDFSDFYISATKFVSDTLNSGWEEKEWVHNNLDVFKCKPLG